MAVGSFLCCLVLVALYVSPALSFPITSEPEQPAGGFLMDEEEMYKQQQKQQKYGDAQHYFVKHCITKIYVIAFTTGEKHAGSDNSHHFELHTDDGNSYTTKLYDREGNDYLENKGDLWIFTPASFGITSCLQKSDIDGVYFEAGGNDGWMIDTAMVVYSDQNTKYNLLTVDVGINKWLDGNGGKDQRRVQLTLV
jgi:nuclear transport factor 2 (NTF2) superfamily protein